MISKRCTYGLQALQYLASYAPDGGYVPIRRISAHYGISQSFLTKILQDLCREGWIISYRGPKGGVSLAQSARGVSLIEIIQALDGPDVFNSCVLGFPDCNQTNPCPLHQAWEPAYRSIEHVLTAHTVATLAQSPPIGVRQKGKIVIELNTK